MSGRETRLWGPGDVAEAAAALRAGGLVAFPTETVYGLGARADDAAAVAAIYAAKGRPSSNPLILHCPDAATALALIDAPPDARRLADAFWPGPLTLVAARSAVAQVAEAATAGLDTLAVRVPAAPLARALLARVGAPVAAPSANPSGRVSPTTAAHVLDGLGGRIDGVLDGGPCAVGLESSIVAFGTDGAPALLRPGGAPREALETTLGAPLAEPAPRAPDRPLAPGAFASHYAPGAALRLDAAAPEPGEAWLGFGPEPAGVGAGPARNLSPSGDPAEAAAALYAALRALDTELGGAGRIAVAPIPGAGLGAAIRDRLRRAAAPRG